VRVSGRKRRKGVGAKSGTLSSRQHRLIIVALVLLFVCIAAIRWSSELPIGSDCDEHMIVAQTFIRTGHFSVADIHSTKYPPLTSSIAIVFEYLGLNAPLSMVVLNCLAVLVSALVVCALILRSNGIGMLVVLPVLYLMSNTVLWTSASEIMADATFLCLVSVVLLLALRVEEWTLRRTLLATLVAFLAAMSRSVGIVVIFPLAAAIISDHRSRGRSFPYAKVALLALLPLASLALYMMYEARFGPHPTGYVETFLLRDPLDAGKGSLTLVSFLGRALRGSVDTLRNIRDLTVYPSSPGVFSWAAAVYPSLAGVLSFAALAALFAFALGRDKKRILVLCAFIVPYMIVVCLWPFKGARFVLPLLVITTLGIGGALAASLRSRHRVLVYVLVLLVVSHIAINTVNLRRQAGEQTQARAFMHSRVGELVEWCRANVPEGERIASPDYREVMLRLDRPVLPLSYSSDAQMHIAELERGDVKWLVFSWHIYPLRGTYAKGVVDALGDRASLEYENDSFEAYRIDVR
jgi:hypothetical protein